MLEAQGHTAAGTIMSKKNSSDTIGNRTRDFPAGTEVPQPSAPPRGTPLRRCHLFFDYELNI